jgi:uncharacterized protein (TIGR02996 family)
MPPAPAEYLALLAEAKANPDDDTPRLVLADWLQDRGDPRGELLALGLAMHRLGEDDPRWAALRRRERQLLGRHVFDWLGPLIDRASQWTFQRGFLHIEARAESFLTADLDDLAGGDLFAWVERLKLRDVHSHHLTRLAGSFVVGTVPSLDLSDNRLGNYGLARLLESPGVAALHELRLARDHIGTNGAERLAGCPHLAGLVRLDLAGNRLNDAAVLALAESPHLARLESLDVRGNNLTTDALIALRARFGKGARAGPLRAEW